MKMLPLKPFNLTLDSINTKSNFNWNEDSFEKTFTVDYCYNSFSQKDNYWASADSICESKGFRYAVKVQPSDSRGCYPFNYNVAFGVANPNSGSAVTELVCRNSSGAFIFKNVADEQLKIKAEGNYNSGVWLKLSDDPFILTHISGLLEAEYVCKVFSYDTTNGIKKVHLIYGTGKDIDSLKVVKGDSLKENGYVDKINCTNADGGNTTVSIGWNWTVWYPYENNKGWDASEWGLVGGKVLANAFCDLDYMSGSHATAIHYIMDSKADANKPLINVTYKSQSGETGIVIDEVECTDGSEYYLDDPSPYFEGNAPAYVGNNPYPKELINIYTPEHYANQTELLRRLCGNDKLFGYVFDPNTHTDLSYLWDLGSKGIWCSNCQETEITCEME